MDHHRLLLKLAAQRAIWTLAYTKKLPCFFRCSWKNHFLDGIHEIPFSWVSLSSPKSRATMNASPRSPSRILCTSSERIRRTSAAISSSFLAFFEVTDLGFLEPAGEGASGSSVGPRGWKPKSRLTACGIGFYLVPLVRQCLLEIGSLEFRPLTAISLRLVRNSQSW